METAYMFNTLRFMILNMLKNFITMHFLFQDETIQKWFNMEEQNKYSNYINSIVMNQQKLSSF